MTSLAIPDTPRQSRYLVQVQLFGPDSRMVAQDSFHLERVRTQPVALGKPTKYLAPTCCMVTQDSFWKERERSLMAQIYIHPSRQLLVSSSPSSPGTNTVRPLLDRLMNSGFLDRTGRRGLPAWPWCPNK